MREHAQRDTSFLIDNVQIAMAYEDKPTTTPREIDVIYIEIGGGSPAPKQTRRTRLPLVWGDGTKADPPLRK